MSSGAFRNPTASHPFTVLLLLLSFADPLAPTTFPTIDNGSCRFLFADPDSFIIAEMVEETEEEVGVVVAAAISGDA
jgi:hypothetical protein